MRHRLLAAEMALRGYHDRTPIVATRRSAKWPGAFVTAPADQFALLGLKYAGRMHGRISLPRRTHELWAQHKYSVMARDPAESSAIGRRVARLRGTSGMEELAAELTAILRQCPAEGRLANAIEHMWGHVAETASEDDRRAASRSVGDRFARTQALALARAEPFLLASTALSELAAFIPR